MNQKTKHILLVGDCTKAPIRVKLDPIDLLITSPPYFNAPFDYKDLFKTYETFLQMIDKFAFLYFDILKQGAIAAINIDDMLIRGIKYPIISDTIKIFENRGYTLRGRVVWKKPEGYIRISRRSGVLIQNPFPMYYYPDNLTEGILIFQKPNGNKSDQEKGDEFEDIWEITNVLPFKGRLEENIAAFPDELPRKLIKAFTNKYQNVCDPFIGSGTTMKVARELNRNSLGIELLPSLVQVIQKKVGFSSESLTNYFDGDMFCIEEINGGERSYNEGFTLNTQKTKYSYLDYALNSKIIETTNQKYHLLLFDCRNMLRTLLNESFKKILNQVIYGRMAILYYDPINKIKDKIKIYDLFDFLMKNGFRFRDKITVQHEHETHWEVKTRKSSKIVFKHNFFEILLFQKGKYDYKSKSRESKQECLIDIQKFQNEKWFLTLWDMRPYPRKKCDPIVTRRMVELFLYNNEFICTNLEYVESLNRHITLEKIDLK